MLRVPTPTKATARLNPSRLVLGSLKHQPSIHLTSGNCESRNGDGPHIRPHGRVVMIPLPITRRGLVLCSERQDGSSIPTYLLEVLRR